MKAAGHSAVEVSQEYVHPSPEPNERAFERLELMNMTAQTQLSATIPATEAEEKVTDSKEVVYNDGGSACGLVFAQDFKSCGPDYIGTVGSIPTHFRQLKQ